MERLEKFYEFINVILIVVILFLEGQIVHHLETSGLHNFWILFLVTAVLLIAILKFGEWLIEKLVENIDWLKKLVMGDEYIEGVWFDIVEIDGKNFYGLLTIIMKNGNFYINGTQYNDQAYQQSSWKTIASNFENFSLRTIYQTTYFDEMKIEEPYGISIYNFQKSSLHKKPSFFSGSFYDLSRDFITKSFYGFKISDKNILKKLNDPSLSITATLELIQSPYFLKAANETLGKQ